MDQEIYQNIRTKRLNKNGISKSIWNNFIIGIILFHYFGFIFGSKGIIPSSIHNWLNCLTSIFLSGITIWYFMINKTRIKIENSILYWFYVIILIYSIIGFFINYINPGILFPLQKIQAVTALLYIGSIFIFSNLSIIRKLSLNWFKYVPILFFVIYIHLFQESAYASYFVLLLFFVPFFELLDNKKKTVLLLGLIIAIIYYGQRINLLYLLSAIIIYIQIKFRVIQNSKIIFSICNVFLIVPFILFFMAVFNSFNVLSFNNDDENTMYGNEQIYADTRTFIYEEAILDAKNNNTFLLGKTPYYGYESPWLAMYSSTHSNITNTERTSEVYIVNIFVYMGLLGVFIIFAIFYYSIKKAVCDSNNFYIKTIGLYLSILWPLLWIGFSNSTITLDTTVIYLLIGLSLNKPLRKADNRAFILVMKKCFSTKKLKK